MAKKKAQTWFSKAELHEAIHGQNPWWETAKVPAAFVKPYRRSAYYEAVKFVDNGSSQRAVMLLGARRVGKTSILYQLIDHALGQNTSPRKILFLSLDHPLFQFSNLHQLLEQAAQCAEIRRADFEYIYLDEIQYTPDWAKWLKTFVQEPIKRRIVATGSAAATLKAKGPDEGVGRWIDVLVSMLSLAEFTVLRGHSPAAPPQKFNLKNPAGLAPLDADSQQRVMAEFQEYLLRGGFPELAAAGLDLDTAQSLLSGDIAEKVLHRDMAALYGVRQLLSLKQIFLAVAFRSSEIIDRAKLAVDFQVSSPTVNQYLLYLQYAFLIRQAFNYNPAANKAVRSHPKLYVSDAALRHAVMRRGAAVLENPQGMGPIVETTVFNQVFAWARENLSTVYYWRSPQKPYREVDVVVCTQEGKLIPLEVKYQNQIRDDDLRGLREFREKYGSRVIASYLITKNLSGPDAERAEAEQVTIMPAHEFVWRLAWSSADLSSLSSSN